MTLVLYERLNSGEDGQSGAGGTTWKAQTFTIGNSGANEAHIISAIKLKGWRFGAPGVLTASIRTADTSENPAGADLSSGTINIAGLISSYPGDWIKIDLSPEVVLNAGIQYAIVVRCPNGDADNLFQWDIDTGAGYGGGSHRTSSNSGSSWSSGGAQDFIFEEYGLKARGGIGTRHIKTDWPVVEGLTAETTKLKEEWKLEYEETKVLKKDREGI